MRSTVVVGVVVVVVVVVGLVVVVGNVVVVVLLGFGKSVNGNEFLWHNKMHEIKSCNSSLQSCVRSWSLVVITVGALLTQFMMELCKQTLIFLMSALLLQLLQNQRVEISERIYDGGVTLATQKISTISRPSIR